MQPVPNGLLRDKDMEESLTGFLSEMDAYRKENRHGIATSMWLEAADGHVYVRIGDRFFAGDQQTYVTISNIEVWKDYRRQGRFRRIMALVETWAATQGYGVLIENVMSGSVTAMYRGDPHWVEWMNHGSLSLVITPSSLQNKIKEQAPCQSPRA